MKWSRTRVFATLPRKISDWKTLPLPSIDNPEPNINYRYYYIAKEGYRPLWVWNLLASQNTGTCWFPSETWCKAHEYTRTHSVWFYFPHLPRLCAVDELQFREVKNGIGIVTPSPYNNLALPGLARYTATGQSRPS